MRQFLIELVLICRIKVTEMSGKAIFSCHNKILVQGIRLVLSTVLFCFYSLKALHGELGCISSFNYVSAIYY